MMPEPNDVAELVIPIVHDTITVRKRIYERERVVVHKTVDEVDETIQVLLQHDDVTVEHVAIGRVIDAAPPIREVDGVTIIPVVEERLVVRTELVLREELHVRRTTRMQPTEQTIRVRREVVAIERHAGSPHLSRGSTDMALGTTANTGLMGDDYAYDPAVHEDQVVALYETRAQAQSALDKLTAEGLGAGAHIADHTAGTTTATTAEDEGVWGSIKRLFAPDEEAHGYAEGLRRGHALLIAHPTAATRARVIDVLETTNPIDFDSKIEEWRGAGWTGATAGAATGALGMAATTATTPAKIAATLPATTAKDGVLEVMEERLRVGKRDVSRGGVRVRSYVVERPVEESVTLREESIHLDRRPVDRALAPGEAAFQDRTVEVTATAEEAIVDKQARVVEEIALRKDAADRVETIHDTVRHTEVEVEDTRTTTETTIGKPVKTGF